MNNLVPPADKLVKVYLLTMAAAVVLTLFLAGIVIFPFVPFLYISWVHKKYIPFPDIQHKAINGAIVGAVIGILYVFMLMYIESVVEVNDEFVGLLIFVIPLFASIAALTAHSFVATHLLQKRLGGKLMYSSIFIGIIMFLLIGISTFLLSKL